MLERDPQCHALVVELVERHRDRDGAGRDGDIRGILAGCRLGGEADQLPGSFQPLGYQCHREWHRIGIGFSQGLKQWRDLRHPLVVKLRDPFRQSCVEFHKHIASAQHMQHLDHVVEGCARGGILRKLGPGQFGPVGRGKRVLENLDDLGLKRGCDLQQFPGIVGGVQVTNRLVIVARHRR